MKPLLTQEISPRTARHRVICTGPSGWALGCWLCVGSGYAGAGGSAETAYANWRSRLPWWRRWLVKQAKPRDAGHVPPRPVPPPAPRGWTLNRELPPAPAPAPQGTR